MHVSLRFSVVAAALLSALFPVVGFAFAAELPKIPADVSQIQAAEPVKQCSANGGVYFIAYIAPDGNTGYQVFGEYEMRGEDAHLSAPVLLIVAASGADDVVYLKTGDHIRTMSVPELVERFPDPCKVLTAAGGVSA